MTETYCGKCCEGCNFAQQLNCSGCKIMPYSPTAAQCAIASCCKSKGHERCETCGFQAACPTLRKQDYIPGQILERQAALQKRLEAEAEARARALQSAGFLGTWLWPLFWLVVPGQLGGLLTGDLFRQRVPLLYWVGFGLTVFALLAYGLILLKMADENDCYRTAGICGLIAAAVSTAMLLLFPEGPPAWTLLITLPAAAIRFAGEYQEFQGHSQVLEPVNRQLSDQWDLLWKHYLYSIGAIYGSILLVLIAPRLGIWVLLAALIAFVILSIRKLVYLYRTARFFRAFADCEKVRCDR